MIRTSSSRTHGDGLGQGRRVPEALTRLLLFLSLVFAALALVPSGAHLAELANKIDLPREDYLVVQQIYHGWALFGIAVLGALASTGALAFALRSWPAILAFLCIAGTQVVFWTFTYPANQATRNWTMLPENWLPLRTQWEYSHAGSALLNLVALLALAYLATRKHGSCAGRASRLHLSEGLRRLDNPRSRRTP